MEFPNQSLLLSEPRQDHYWFAHRVVRDACQQNPIQFFAGFSGIRSDNQYKLIQWMLDLTESLAGEPVTVLSFENLDVITDLIADCPSIIITMPPPLAITEAYMIGVVLTGEAEEKTQDESFRYFTLELGQNADGNLRTVICEWTDEAHLNFGDGPSVSVDAFVQAIENKLKALDN